MPHPPTCRACRAGVELEAGAPGPTADGGRCSVARPDRRRRGRPGSALPVRGAELRHRTAVDGHDDALARPCPAYDGGDSLRKWRTDPSVSSSTGPGVAQGTHRDWQRGCWRPTPVPAMNFAFTDEQEELAQGRAPVPREQVARDRGPGAHGDRGRLRPGVWAQMADQLGPGPDHPRGVRRPGFSLRRAGRRARGDGPALLCAPYFSTVALAANALLQSGDEAAKKAPAGHRLGRDHRHAGHHRDQRQVGPRAASRGHRQQVGDG